MAANCMHSAPTVQKDAYGAASEDLKDVFGKDTDHKGAPGESLSYCICIGVYTVVNHCSPSFLFRVNVVCKIFFF